jgi:ATP-dependent Clp protease ATP-binding subunit ClpC
MIDKRLTAGARTVLENAEVEARELGHGWVGSEHVLLALLREPGGCAGWAFADIGWEPERLRDRIVLAASTEQPTPGARERGFSSELEHALARATAEADRLGHHFIESDHLLLGILADDTTAVEMISGLGIVRGNLTSFVERRFWEGV